MSTIDMRRAHTKVDTLIIGDDQGGTGKVWKIEKHLPVQVNLVTVGGDTVHIKTADIPTLRKALDYIESNWKEE